MGIRCVGVCLKPDPSHAESVLPRLQDWLGERGVEVALGPGCEEAAGSESIATVPELAERCDLLVSLGGDGTLLSVARGLGTQRVPILGVNLGTLGFLTEVNVDELFEVLEGVLAGEAQVVSRMRLEVVATRGDREIARYQALNEVVVDKSSLSRMIRLDVEADNQPVTTYHADGLIVATPTGSTAYSLSAGGPIILPGTEVIALTPICPHALTQRPLVLPQSARVIVRVRSHESEVSLTADGYEGLALMDGDAVEIRKSGYPVDIIASPRRSRFDILRAKLRWGER